jgi:hypothetical protein
MVHLMQKCQISILKIMLEPLNTFGVALESDPWIKILQVAKSA